MRCGSPISVAERFGTPAPFTAPDGTRLFARLAGPVEGPPIVLVHGFSMASHAFCEQLQGTLAARFRLIAPDLRGHGMSHVGPDLEVFGHASTWGHDLAAAIRAFASRPPLLVGWSYGSRVLCAFLGQGGVAAGAVFVSAVTLDPLADGTRPHGPAAAILPDVVSDDDAVAQAATIRFVERMPAAPFPAPLRERLIAASAAVPRAVLRAMLRLRSDNRALLERLAIPVLALHGAEDAVIRPAAACATAAATGGEVLMMDRVGHAPFLEAPAAFDAALAHFAERCGIGAGG